MFTATSSHVYTVALIGNPNTGKSTLFSGLVGVRQHVGNYPGVTVEKKVGRMELADQPCDVIDLPGVYSIAPRSLDEMVTVDILLGRCEDVESIDAVLCIVDASNLDRNLYLVSQVLELGIPMVLAVNMMDVAESHGIRLDLKRLEQCLGIPVIPVQAHRKIGLDELRQSLIEAMGQEAVARETVMPKAFEKEVDRLEGLFKNLPAIQERQAFARFLMRRLLLDMNGYLQQSMLDDPDGRLPQEIEAARERLRENKCAVPGVETESRYDWVRGVLDEVVVKSQTRRTTASDRLDHILTHRFWGLVVFVVVMAGMFQAVFVWAKPAMEGIEWATAATAHWVEFHMSEGTLRSLLIEGVIGGVGGILAFLPQILILFGFLAVLEDCGYMARTAYLMDRLMVSIGLSGKAFIPMLSSFACAVPGIMATRVIEDRRDRLVTILITPLLTCSARLPVYTLLIAAFIPPKHYWGGVLNLQGLTLAMLYLLGIVASITVAFILKRTILKGQTPPFVMELPSYKWPSLSTVFHRMMERGWIFLRCAGTLILAVSILVWAALYYPHDPKASPQQQQQNSILGQMGKMIEPAVKPLGWDWRIGCSVLASFPAREIVVATMGVMYNLGDMHEQKTGKVEWTDKLREVTREDNGQLMFNIPVALSIMVFFALCAQCMPTMAVIRRETNSWRWPVFAFSYMTVLAYFGALITYQLGMWIGG